MDKRDIYEHLAKIYLDASLKRRKKSKRYSKYSNILLVGIAGVILVVTILILNTYHKNKPLDSELALVLQPETIKINFHFDPAKKEIYSINLKGLTLGRFKTLGFSTRKANYQDNISLRVEFESTFKEKSEVYLKDIPHRWQDYKIPFLDFKNISDWSGVSRLSFIVEEWNVKEKKGVVYIDNVRFLR